MGKNRLFPEKSADELLKEFVTSGAQAPFEEIVRRYAGMVYSVCYRVTSNSHDAEDATQAVFLSLALQAKTGKPIHYIGPWLQRVAHRLALDVKKSKTRRKHREEKLAEMNGSGNGRFHHAPNPADAPVDDELKRVMNEELSQMPAKYRMPLILHYFGGMNREEMAKELNCKPATLGVRVHRGRAMLGKRLAKRGVMIGASLPFVIESTLHASIPAGLVENTAQSVFLAGMNGGGDGVAGLLVASKVIAIARTCAKAAMYGKMRAAIAIVLAFGLTSAIAGPTVVQSVKEMKLRLTAPFDVTKIVRPLLRMITPELRAEKTEEKKAEVVVVPAPPLQNEVKLTVPPVEPLRVAVVDSPSAKAQATGGGGAANAGGSSAAPAPVEVVRRNPIEDIEEFLRIAPAPRESAPLPVGGGGGGGSISLADARGNRTSAQAQAEGSGETAATPPIDVSTGRMTLGGGGGTPMNFELASEQTVHTKGSVIGDTGLGHFRQSKGRHKVDGDLVLGNEPGSKGVYEMTGGSVEAGGLVVGNKGEGLFNQVGGWTSADNVAIAKEEGSVGTYILDGESSLTGGKITVAVRGTGTLDNRGGEITLSAGESSYSSALWYSEAQEPATLNVAQDATANGNLVMRSGRLLFQSGQYNPQLRVGVGGDGTLTLGGDGGSDLVQIAEEKSSVKTNLVVRAYASGRGVLKGHGDVFLTGTLFMNGKVLADGFNVERTLDLSHFSKVDNRIENPIEGGTNGWVARRKGALLLPPVPVKRGTDTYNWGEAETDKNIDLVNSVRFTAHDAQYPGEVNISLLSTDRSDIPTLPGAHRFLSVWSFDPSDIEAEGGFDITVRYNDVLAKSLGIEETLLKFWAYNGSWVRINDESFHRDLTKNLIGGHFDTATFFAVSAPEPSGATVLLIGVSALVLRRRRAAVQSAA